MGRKSEVSRRSMNAKQRTWDFILSRGVTRSDLRFGKIGAESALEGTGADKSRGTQAREGFAIVRQEQGGKRGQRWLHKLPESLKWSPSWSTAPVRGAEGTGGGGGCYTSSLWVGGATTLNRKPGQRSNYGGGR